MDSEKKYLCCFISVTDLAGTVLVLNVSRISFFHEVPIEHRQKLLQDKGILMGGETVPTAISLSGDPRKIIVKNSVEDILKRITGE